MVGWIFLVHCVSELQLLLLCRCVVFLLPCMPMIVVQVEFVVEGRHLLGRDILLHRGNGVGVAMVTTQSHTVGVLYEKGVRLKNKLLALGMLIGRLPIAIYFGVEPPSLLTRRFVWAKFMDLESIMFVRFIDGVEYTLGIGCVHALDKRCPACDVDPNADVKHNDLFAKMRAWKVCQLWNVDDYVNGREDRVI